MTFDDIPSGRLLFVDANTLVYHFAAEPVLGPPCQRLLDRINGGDVRGFISTDVLSDVAHRLMSQEAIRRFGWPLAGIAQRLRSHPSHVQQLSDFRAAIDEVLQSGIHVLSIPPPLVATAAAVSQQFGLLSGDALIVAVMHEHGLVNLASHDSDFDRVPGLTRYAPA
jgi:predicted nucleic acid-binding protein